MGSPYPKPACKEARREHSETLGLGSLELQGPICGVRMAQLGSYRGLPAPG